MPNTHFLRLALLMFLVYCAVFPGSVITVALDAVPPWGETMGAALLVLQGTAVVCWMLGMYGRRGAVAVLGAFVLAWAVEHVGETTGFPFGRYQYTEMLQPQLAGVVPVPITLAWLMAAFGSWQLARLAFGERAPLAALLALTGALVVVLDLQIETVATFINPYWAWIDTGPYYGVPTVNFVAWFVVGALMALIVTLALGNQHRVPAGKGRWVSIVRHIPALLYVLSSVMFMVVNFARGYPVAGIVGLLFLAAVVVFAMQRVPNHEDTKARRPGLS
jgi:uncharacterized membrane protein